MKDEIKDSFQDNNKMIDDLRKRKANVIKKGKEKYQDKLKSINSGKDILK